ncbi:MAG: hypothetical protein HKN32_08835, partial [Flavobacteriales bacterium]|nr:hypothetical protein [Flavobacteriales bacterium]
MSEKEFVDKSRELRAMSGEPGIAGVAEARSWLAQNTNELTVTTVTAATLVSGAGLASAESDTTRVQEVVEVEDGDTLYGLVEEFLPEDTPHNEVLDTALNVAAANNIEIIKVDGEHIPIILPGSEIEIDLLLEGMDLPEQPSTIEIRSGSSIYAELEQILPDATTEELNQASVAVAEHNDIEYEITSDGAVHAVVH